MPAPRRHTSESASARAPLLAAMVRGALRAAAACRLERAVPGGPRVARKPDASVVTPADLAAQALITRELRTADPGVAIVGEESAPPRSAAPRTPHGTTPPATPATPDALSVSALPALAVELLRSLGQPWSHEELIAALGRSSAGDAVLPRRYVTIDPVDGTSGFIHGRQYSICAALVEDGQPVAACVACPAMSADPASDFTAIDPVGSVFFALEGRGVGVLPADLDPDTIRPEVLAEAPRVRREPLEPDGPVCMTVSVEQNAARREHLADLTAALGSARPPARLDGQCKYVLVAQGRADIYYRRPRPGGREHVWDHAAGHLLVREAGCTCADALGRVYRFDAPTFQSAHGILAAPPRLHERLRAVLARLGLVPAG